MSGPAIPLALLEEAAKLCEDLGHRQGIALWIELEGALGFRICGRDHYAHCRKIVRYAEVTSANNNLLAFMVRHVAKELECARPPAARIAGQVRLEA